MTHAQLERAVADLQKRVADLERIVAKYTDAAWVEGGQRASALPAETGEDAVLREREACALVADGFDSASNSEAMKPFVHDATVVSAVYRRDAAIAAAIRARPAPQRKE